MENIVIGFTIFIFAFALYNEIVENGCDLSDKSVPGCHITKNVYLKGTYPSPNDSCDTMYKKIISILSFHEKNGLWKKCLIIGSLLIIALTIFMLGYDMKLFNYYQYLLLLIIFTCIIYFYHNYLIHHYFQRLKDNGQEIIELIKQKCQS